MLEEASCAISERQGFPNLSRGVLVGCGATGGGGPAAPLRTGGERTAAGLALHLDHASANCSEPVQEVIERLGTTPSFGFVEECQTDAVLYRPDLSRKEEIIGERISRALDQVRKVMLQS